MKYDGVKKEKKNKALSGAWYTDRVQSTSSEFQALIKMIYEQLYFD